MMLNVNEWILPIVITVVIEYEWLVFDFIHAAGEGFNELTYDIVFIFPPRLSSLFETFSTEIVLCWLFRERLSTYFERISSSTTNRKNRNCFICYVFFMVKKSSLSTCTHVRPGHTWVFLTIYFCMSLQLALFCLE